jgi:predicted nucleic acid-binding protein
VSDAFDSDVLIYAANGLPLGAAVSGLLAALGDPIGSVLLLPETLSKPLRRADEVEEAAILGLLQHFDLKPVDWEIAKASATFGAKYGLRAADAIHLATAVVWGADRFHTNNRKDFGPHITEVEVVWPEASEGARS